MGTEQLRPNSTLGQLGDGTTTQQASPTQIGSGFTAIAAGDFHTLAFKSGALFSWGDNLNGQLGSSSGNTACFSGPCSLIALQTPGKYVTVAAGADYSVAMSADGLIWSWGTNTDGQLGDATYANKVKPGLVVNSSVTDFLDLAPTVPNSPIPSYAQPPFFVKVQKTDNVVASDTFTSINTTTRFNAGDLGKLGAVYVTAMVPKGTLVVAQSTGSSSLSRSSTILAASTQTQYELIQFTASGAHLVVNSQLLPYASGVIGDQLKAQTILNNTSTTNLKGAVFCVGYGTSADQMIVNGTMRAVANIPLDPNSTVAPAPSCVVTTASNIPAGFVATPVNATQINLSWTAPLDTTVTGYRVYRNGALAGSPSTTAYGDTGLAASTAYSYTVAACFAGGNCSPQSIPASATTAVAPDTTAPTVPGGLEALPASATQINLFWTASADSVGVTRYKVERNGVPVATVATTSYSDSGLAASTAYSYTVAACDAVGNCSQKSSAALITAAAAPDTAAPSVPGGLEGLPASATQINLFWMAATDNVGVTRYKVERNGLSVATVATTSYSDSGLTASTAYSYTVAACDAAGNCSQKSAATVITTANTPGFALAVNISLTQGWNLAGNANNTSLDVAATFGDVANVVSVWKWVAGSGRWAFYSPLMTGQALVEYVTGKGYDLLGAIAGGEGFWINAKQAFSFQTPAGATVLAADFRSSGGKALLKGWNMIAVGETQTPRQFNAAMASDVTTLWAWDSSQYWYFYAPNLDAGGELAKYIAGKGYVDFTATGKALGPGVGFWVNSP